MAASHVQVQPDSTGKDIDADSIVSTEAGTPIVYRQVTIIGDPTTYGNKVSVGVSGGLSVKGALPAIQTLNVTAATPVTGTGLNVSEAGVVTFVIKNTIAATAFTGVPVVVFEQSDDNVSWAPLMVVNNANGAIGSTPVVATGAVNISQMFDASVEGVNWVRSRVTTAQTANGMTIITQPGGLAFTPVTSTIVPPPSVGTVTSVAAVAASTTLLSANINRKQAMFFNDSSATLYLILSAGAASTTAFTTKVLSQGYYEIPWPTYTGQVNGIWSAATGSVRVTEQT